VEFRGVRRRVAVTGLGVVSPVGVGADAFWESLVAGRSGIAAIESFDTTAHRVRIAGEVAHFPAAEWVGARDAARLDRFCHFALAAAKMGVAHAGVDSPPTLNVGTVFASGIGGAAAIRTAVSSETQDGPDAVPPLFVPSAIPNMAAAFISRRFGFRGPSVCPVSACSSSTDAIGIGFRMVRDGYVDMCVVGGSEACVVPTVMAGFAGMGALSRRNEEPTRASRPFDGDRDGFVMGEGAGALVLESLTAARERGAEVLAEIRGFGQTSDAYHETAPAPDGAGAAEAISAALGDAQVSVRDVDYINAHGTSTYPSDVAETEAIKRALGAHASTVAISSTKSMTGHLLGAAGAVEAVATVLSICHQEVPPTINLENPDSRCDLDYVPNRARRIPVSTALSNSMGFGGHNSCVVFCSP
jgi:3-oxoacyl-[acyl-carrier-protein] synthase II